MLNEMKYKQWDIGARSVMPDAGITLRDLLVVLGYTACVFSGNPSSTTGLVSRVDSILQEMAEAQIKLKKEMENAR